MLIDLRVDAGLARITLNRPEKRNALNAALITALSDALAATAADQKVRVVLLGGAGADFCSGADLSGLNQSAEAGVLEHLATARQLAETFLAMRQHPRPIVAAVRGRALAGGCGLATACDLVLAAASAQFGYPEVKIGFVPAMVMSILRRSVGEKRAFELIATGEVIGAEQARADGLINRVFPDDEFERGVEDYVQALAAKSASAVSLGKNLLYHMDGMSFEAALQAGVQANAIARMTEDARRGIERFVKKS
ncbi:MAG TPA: enoyl-CoA hydratase-related protein [Bryobacteraceae bacterium]|jgi:methylglutaconyl-CoA hydratase|nr:enoyl-CoA hydratase-related protein [Bryobacteraceae bacterium]